MSHTPNTPPVGDEIFLLKLGELVLKGLNRHTFEERLMGNARRRLQKYGKFRIYSRQSITYIEPKDDLHPAVPVGGRRAQRGLPPHPGRHAHPPRWWSMWRCGITPPTSTPTPPGGAGGLPVGVGGGWLSPSSPGALTAPWPPG